MKAPVCSHLILQYVVDIKYPENERFIYLFFSIDILNILLPIDLIQNEQHHKRGIKNNRVVYLVFHYQYVMFLNRIRFKLINCFIVETKYQYKSWNW
jgi:hypothetical protein